MPEQQKPFQGDPMLGGSNIPQKQRRPRRPKFPLSLEKFLLLALPQRRPEDRMAIYRQMMRSYLHLKDGRPPSDEEVAAEIHLVRQRKFTIEQCNALLGYVRDSADLIKADNLKKRAKAGAAGRWKKTC
jgi:hypothetical protein